MTHGYRLPRAVADRLSTALEGRKNASAALALAEFLARFWSAPTRLLAAFPIDRRALASVEALGLTEARVRGAIAALVEVGFIDPIEAEAGKRYQRTAEGLQRRAVLFRFAPEYGTIFAKANARAQAVRGAPAPARRPPTPPRPPVSLPAHSTAMPTAQVAHKQSSGGSRLIMGEKLPGGADSPLEAALERWRKAIGR